MYQEKKLKMPFSLSNYIVPIINAELAEKNLKLVRNTSKLKEENQRTRLIFQIQKSNIEPEQARMIIELLEGYDYFQHNPSNAQDAQFVIQYQQLPLHLLQLITNKILCLD